MAIHRNREEESKENKTFPAPTLIRSHYPVITNGRAAEPATITDGKITKVETNILPSPYATAFTAAKNKEVWDFCTLGWKRPVLSNLYRKCITGVFFSVMIYLYL
jgi:hypothetical protein